MAKLNLTGLTGDYSTRKTNSRRIQNNLPDEIQVCFEHQRLSGTATNGTAPETLRIRQSLGEFQLLKRDAHSFHGELRFATRLNEGTGLKYIRVRLVDFGTGLLIRNLVRNSKRVIKNITNSVCTAILISTLAATTVQFNETFEM